MQSYLEANHERWIVRDYKNYYLTDQDIEQAVFYSWEASGENPGWWGQYNGRKLGAIRILLSAYGESSLNLYCAHVNKNKSVDMGPMQVNSCHWFNMPPKSPWGRYCFGHHLDPNKIETIVNPRNNFGFAAYLNELFMKTGQDTYHYDGRISQVRFYTFLLKRMGMENELTDFKKKEEEVALNAGN